MILVLSFYTPHHLTLFSKEHDMTNTKADPRVAKELFSKNLNLFLSLILSQQRNDEESC